MLVDGDGRLGLLRQRDIVLNAASQHGTPTSDENPIIGKIVTRHSSIGEGKCFCGGGSFASIPLSLTGTPPIQVEDKMISNPRTTGSHRATAVAVTLIATALRAAVAIPRQLSQKFSMRCCWK